MSNTELKTSSIAYCKIHPGIGIARLGNSPEEYFIGPEVPDSAPRPKDELFKDKDGQVKRQAVRFRIYAYDSNDKVLKELTSDDCSINWTVHLANRKGDAKFFFPASMDTPNNNNLKRNRTILNRDTLIIDPGPLSIKGISQSGNNYKFNKGNFLNFNNVYLGELRTDEKGRLLVLGGFGNSEGNSPASDYANNDSWYDDTSDGPVTASVILNNGTNVSVKDSSWVIVAPPKFAPYTYPLVTLFDTMKQEAIDNNWWLTKSTEVSFTKDIFPIFLRITQYKWINNLFRNFLWINDESNNRDLSNGNPEFLKMIVDMSKNKDNRIKDIFSKFRNPKPQDPIEAATQANDEYMPPLSGDNGDASEGMSTTYMTLRPFQYENLKRWSVGDFIFDWNENLQLNLFEQRPIEEFPLEEQPSALDRSALDLSIGAPFMPGIEITYNVYDPTIYDKKPFRINPNLRPGDITQRMALPWQADFLACAGNWWPAARPDDVIPEDIIDPNNQNELNPERWERGLRGGFESMVKNWSKLGFIKPQKANDTIFYVEKERSL